MKVPRPRITISLLMLMIALLAVSFSWMAMRSRHIAVIDVTAPNRVAFGDRAYDLPSLQKDLSSRHAGKVVIRAASNVPYRSLLQVVKTEFFSGPLDRCQQAT
jgi:biopolymer transport protein ExbD